MEGKGTEAEGFSELIAGKVVSLSGGLLKIGEVAFPTADLRAEARELDHVQTWWNRFVSAGILAFICIFVSDIASITLWILCAFGVYRARHAENEYYLHLMSEGAVYRMLRNPDPGGVGRVAQAVEEEQAAPGEGRG